MFGFLNFAMLVAAALLLVWCIFIGRPLVARERLSAEMSSLSDEVEDAILDGMIADSDEARAFVYQAGRAADSPREFSLSEMHSMVRGLEAVGVDVLDRSRRGDMYADLSDGDAAFLRAYDDRAVAALSEHGTNGSSMWLAFHGAWWLAGVVGALLPSEREAPTAEKAAESTWRWSSRGGGSRARHA